MSSRMRLPLVNALALVWALVWNTLANALPLGGLDTGQLSDLYPNLFVPAGLTFSIWGLIYLGLIGLVVAGFVFARGPASDDPVASIGPWFAVNAVANGLWIVAWHYQYVALSLGLMAVILASLIVKYLRLGIGRTPASGALEAWAVRAPVSLYLAWITVATIANVTTLAVDLGAPAYGPIPAALTVVVLAVAVGIAGRMLMAHRDVIFAGVVVWAFAGIALARSGSTDDGAGVVYAAALVGGGIVALGMVLTWIRRAKGSTPAAG